MSKQPLEVDIDLDSNSGKRLRVVRGTEDLPAANEVESVSDPSQVARLLEQVKTLQDQKRELEELLESIANSNSWRLTAPLRGLLSAIRSCFPLFRNRRYSCNLIPLQSIETRAGKFYGNGPTPALRLESESRQMPGGWVMVDYKLNTARSYEPFLLMYDEGTGFSGEKRFWLTLEPGSGNTGPHRLPERTAGLRLDPFEADGGFGFDYFTIREIGKLQLVGLLVSRQLQRILMNPAAVWRKLRTAAAVLREGGLPAVKQRLLGESFSANYQEWITKSDTLSATDVSLIEQHIKRLSSTPLISVIMPVYNTPERWLRAAIESVRAQIYQNWELCIADDNSSEPHIERILKEYADRDKRIKCMRRSRNGHIAMASNSALELAGGEYVAFLDHDDELSPHALYMVAVEATRFPDAGLIYSDEDKLTGYGLRFNPHFKSEYNPDLLLQQNYICHLLTLKRDLVLSIGGFREGVDGAQDWDLILRASEQLKPEQVRRIPHVLYHWRVIEGSTAQSTAHKPYVLKAQQKAVEQHLERAGVRGARVEILESISHMRVIRAVPEPSPLVSLIIPTRDQVDILKRCIESIRDETEYANYEIIVVDNGSVEEQTHEYLRELCRDHRVTVLRDQRPFNYSQLNNSAVRAARGELLGFLNNDLEVISPHWLTEMVSHAVRPEVGAVGARLLYPNGFLQHGGVILGIGGVAGHNHKGRPRHDPGYFNRAILTQNLSAVTAACLLVRREVFEKTSGFDEGDLAVAFNDVDLCLQIRKLGYLNVYTPYAELFHHESASRGHENTLSKFRRFEGEVETMKKRWGEVLRSDPYYNPNLTLTSEDFGLAFPTRAVKPWGSDDRT